LAKIPLGLKVKGADYPVLRVFASWPGEAKLERTKKSSLDGIDPDSHPLATLHLANFNSVGQELDQNWFQGDVEQKLVVHSKRAREQDSELSRVRKSARLEARLFPNN
jgi:hypothetical protein